jgi:predicted metal-binding protein
MELEWACKRAVEMGATEAKLIDPKDVVVAEWVRLKCQFGCQFYGQRKTCPPYSPTPDLTRRLLGEYGVALLFRIERRGEEDFLKAEPSVQRLATDLEREIFIAGYPKAFALGAGGCNFCEACNLGGPCPHPERSRPAMEACGIDASSTAANVGWSFAVAKTKASTYQNFGLILVE